MAKGGNAHETFMFCLMMLFLGLPISGKTAILQNNEVLRVKSSSICDGENEDDPATDDGEDLRDGGTLGSDPQDTSCSA
jgi:hypothetical protein